MTSNAVPKLPIYLDYHATTPVDHRVAELMLHYMTTEFGNASSTDHIYGDRAAKAVSKARSQLAELVRASAKEIIFTSGATESINLAIQGTVYKQIDNNNKPRIAFSPLEHKAVLDTCQATEKKGLAELIHLKIDSQGRLDLEHIPFLCDASQAVGKIPIDFEQWGITYLSISGHKFYAPKGVGALVIRKGHYLEPIIFGGGHQKGMRSGTLNMPGIVGLGEACRLRQLEMAEDEKAISLLRDKLQNLLQEKIPNLVVNGDLKSRLAGNLHISIPEIPNSAIIARIRDRLAISTGSACSSGIAAPSYVLRAMNLSEELVESSLRIGLGKFTTEEEIEKAAAIIYDAFKKIDRLMSI